MSQEIAIRSGRDRMRYTMIFEATLLALMVPAGVFVFERSHGDIGILAVFLSVKAMLVNLLYNWLFDRWDVRNGRIPTQRSWKGRTIHALGFEGTLTITSLPFVMWWLHLNVWQALLTDVVMASFVVVYTMLYTWVYDRVFPVAQPALEPVSCSTN
jgi:uncharacterized membrane protein